MSPRISDGQFLILMGCVVVLLGAQTFRDTFGQESIKRVAAQSSGRSPASLVEEDFDSEAEMVVPAVSDVTTPDSSVLLMDWDWACGKESDQVVEVQTPYLRFKGKTCGGLDLSDLEVTMTNETNGFVASVFARGKANYETDLIQLRAGQNLIRLQYMTPSGRRGSALFSVISKGSSISTHQ